MNRSDDFRNSLARCFRALRALGCHFFDIQSELNDGQALACITIIRRLLSSSQVAVAQAAARSIGPDTADRKLLVRTFDLLMDLAHYKPSITVDQFMKSNAYSEHRVNIITALAEHVKSYGRILSDNPKMNPHKSEIVTESRAISKSEDQDHHASNNCSVASRIQRKVQELPSVPMDLYSHVLKLRAQKSHLHKTSDNMFATLSNQHLKAHATQVRSVSITNTHPRSEGGEDSDQFLAANLTSGGNDTYSDMYQRRQMLQMQEERQYRLYQQQLLSQGSLESSEPALPQPPALSGPVEHTTAEVCDVQSFSEFHKHMAASKCDLTENSLASADTGPTLVQDSTRTTMPPFQSGAMEMSDVPEQKPTTLEAVNVTNGELDPLPGHVGLRPLASTSTSTQGQSLLMTSRWMQRVPSASGVRDIPPMPINALSPTKDGLKVSNGKDFAQKLLDRLDAKLIERLNSETNALARQALRTLQQDQHGIVYELFKDVNIVC